MKAYRCEHILEGEWGRFRLRTFDTRDLYNAYMGSLVVIRPNASSWDNMIFKPKYNMNFKYVQNIDTYPKI